MAKYHILVESECCARRGWRRNSDQFEWENTIEADTPQKALEKVMSDSLYWPEHYPCGDGCHREDFAVDDPATMASACIREELEVNATKHWFINVCDIEA